MLSSASPPTSTVIEQAAIDNFRSSLSALKGGLQQIALSDATEKDFVGKDIAKEVLSACRTFLEKAEASDQTMHAASIANSSREMHDLLGLLAKKAGGRDGGIWHDGLPTGSFKEFLDGARSFLDSDVAELENLAERLEAAKQLDNANRSNAGEGTMPPSHEQAATVVLREHITVHEQRLMLLFDKAAGAPVSSGSIQAIVRRIRKLGENGVKEKDVLPALLYSSLLAALKQSKKRDALRAWIPSE